MENKISVFDLNSFEFGVNYALEASAGTGKTYSITRIVEKLLVEYHVGLDKILIVTYTEKAAGELKNRIREILTTPNEKYNGKTIKEMLEGEVNCDVDNASIGTIHSFCRSAIKEFAISANEAIELNLSGNDDLTYFAKQYIRTGKVLKDISFFASNGFGIDDEKILNYFVSVINSYYLDSNFNENESIISYVPCIPNELVVKMLFSDNPLETLAQNNPDLFNEYKILASSTNEKIQKFVECFENFRNFISDTKIKKRKFEIKKTSKEFTDDEYNGFQRLFELKDKIPDSGILEKIIVDRNVKDFYKTFQIYKSENRLQSFNDMIRIIHESVVKDDSELLIKLRQKFRYAIIDEFQDTNQIQFDIFSKVFMCENHNIIVVGDPKQSIYKYQGADVNVYKHAIDLISSDGKLCRLEKNYRSSAGVVSFGNELFKNYTFETEFAPSKYCLLENEENERRLKFDGEYSPGLWTNKEPLLKSQFAKFAVSMIIECTSKDASGRTRLQKSRMKNDEIVYEDVNFSDFVVLARTRSEMQEIQIALNKAGIPNVRHKDDGLFKGIEVAHWLAIIEAINVPDFTGYNRGYFKKALYTKFFDLSLGEISKEFYNTDEPPQIDLFRNRRQLAKQRLWQDLFDEIIADTQIELKLSSLSELQSLAIFKQLQTYFVDYLSNQHDLTQLVNHLKTIISFGKDEGSDDAEAIVAKSTEFNCVRIMTIHASKGLQFPVVISVAGCKGPKKFNDSYTCHHIFENGETKHVLSLTKFDEVGEEEQMEFIRLFYVAYTRSEFLLIAPRYHEKDNKLKTLGSYFEGFISDCANKKCDVDGQKVDLYKLVDFVDTKFSVLKEKTKQILGDKEIADETDQEKEQEKALKKLIKEKKNKVAYQHSYSSLAHPLKKAEEEVIDDELDIDKEGENVEQDIIFDLSAKQIEGNYDSKAKSLEIPDGYPKGALMGNSIHEVFERLDFINYERNLENLIYERFTYNGIIIRNNPEWVEYTKNIVRNTLDAILPAVKGSEKLGEEFKLSSLKNEDKKPEIEFNFNYPNQVFKNYLTGFIDLLFKRGEVYSILDWKSDTLSEEFVSYSDKEELKKQVDKRYSIQRVLYSYCLVMWLKNFYKESEEDIFKNHFGGIYYVFVRGTNKDTTNGIYIQTWDSWEDLKNEFYRIIEGKE